MNKSRLLSALCGIAVLLLDTAGAAVAEDIPADDTAAVKLLKDKWGIGCVLTDADGNVTTLCPKSDDVRDNAAIRDAVSKLRHVKCLFPSGTKGNDQVLAATAKWPPTLEFASFLADAGDDALAYLERFSNLQQLSVCSDRITDACFKHFANLKSLNDLAIGPAKPSSRLKIDGSGLKSLKGLERLEEISIVDCPIDDAGIANLRGMRIRRFLCRGLAITDRGAAALGSIATIEQLALDDVRITDAAFKDFARLDNLQTLSVCRAPAVHGAGLDHLTRLKNLTFIGIRDCPLTDGSLKNLKSIGLKGLSLQRTKITDKSVDDIAAITSLQQFCIGKGELSEKSIARLRQLNDLDIKLVPDEP